MCEFEERVEQTSSFRVERAKGNHSVAVFVLGGRARTGQEETCKKRLFQLRVVMIVFSDGSFSR